MKNLVKTVKYFAPEQANNSLEANVALAYRNYPALKDLNLTPREVLARENALSKLDEYIRNPDLMIDGNDAGISNFARNLFTFDRTKKILLSHIQHVKGLLLKPYNANDWSVQKRIPIQKVNPDKSIDFPQTYDTNMTYKMFLAKFVDNVSVILRSPTPKANNIEWKTHESLKNQRNLDQKEIENNSRLEQFILGLQRIDKDKNHRIYVNALDAFERGEYTRARTIIGDHAKKEFNININVISTKEGLADAFRSLWLMQDAQKNYQESLAEKSNTILNEGSDSKEKQVLLKYQEFVTKYTWNQNEIAKKANQAYDAYLASLAHGSVEYQNAISREAQIKQNIAAAMTLSSATNDFIEKNQDARKYLVELEKIGDMNGIGWLDFSDGTKKIAKETLIVIASFVVTAGIWGLFALAGNAARATVTARTATTMSRTGKVVTASINGAGKIATASANAVNMVKKWWIAGEALIFTTAESLLHSTFRAEWEKSGFTDFFEKFAKNTAMFGAFAGMEKFVTGPMAARFLKDGVNPSLKVTLAQSATLTAGDIVAISTLHAIETGQSGLDGWESILVAFAFRFGFKGVQNHFPNALKRFQSKPVAEQQKIIDDVAKTEGKTPDFSKQVFTYIDDGVKSGASKNWKNSANISQSPKNTATHNKGDIVAEKAERINILNNPQAGSVIEWIGGKNYIYNAWTRQWHIFDGKNWDILSATFPKKWAMTNAEMRQAIMKEFRIAPNSVMKTEIQYSSEIFSWEKNVFTAWWKMGSSPVGTKAKFNIWDETMWNRWEAIYVKQNNGKWKHESSNISATTLADDFFKPHLISGEKVYLSANAKWKLLIDGVELLTPKTVRKPVKIENPPAQNNPAVNNKEIANFFKTERIQSIDDFNSKYKILQDRKKELEIALKKDPKNNDIKSDLLRVETALEKFNHINRGIQEMDSAFIGPKKPTSNLPIKAETAKAVLPKGIPFSPKNIEDAINKASPKAIDDLNVAMQSKDPEKMKTFFEKHWKSIVGGGVALKLLPYWLERNKNNPHAYVPDIMPIDPEKAMAICVECMTDNPLPTIDYKRHSEASNKVILDEKRRESITLRGMKTAEWKAAVTLWEELNTQYSEHFSETFKNKINAAINTPTVENIQQLQNCIGMEAVDKAIGQDGIVWPRTTKAFHEFLNRSKDECIRIYENKESDQNSSTTDTTESSSVETLIPTDLNVLDSSEAQSSSEVLDDNVAGVDQNVTEVEVPTIQN